MGPDGQEEGAQCVANIRIISTEVPLADLNARVQDPHRHLPRDDERMSEWLPALEDSQPHWWLRHKPRPAGDAPEGKDAAELRTPGAATGTGTSKPLPSEVREHPAPSHSPGAPHCSPKIPVLALSQSQVQPPRCPCCHCRPDWLPGPTQPVHPCPGPWRPALLRLRALPPGCWSSCLCSLGLGGCIPPGKSSLSPGSGSHYLPATQPLPILVTLC